MALPIVVGRRSVSHAPMRCDLVTRESIKEWYKLGPGDSLALWVVETIDGAITSTWLVVWVRNQLMQWIRIGLFLVDKDIPITIVLSITILQNKQKQYHALSRQVQDI